jgi:hypothetical protein|eukprot:COSAG06_NODE_1877_length_8156_cov_8.117538_4_plen_67_part_00
MLTWWARVLPARQLYYGGLEFVVTCGAAAAAITTGVIALPMLPAAEDLPYAAKPRQFDHLPFLEPA